jgi:hypothetical protein
VRVEGESGKNDLVSLSRSVKVTRFGNLRGPTVGGPGGVRSGVGGQVGTVDRCRGVWDSFLGTISPSSGYVFGIR